MRGLESLANRVIISSAVAEFVVPVTRGVSGSCNTACIGSLCHIILPRISFLG
ncbi:Uncharacterised protein [Chlamydia trachomatis]|nr:Uncharacterised protein [Chlamydia trachomatis]